MLKIILTLGNLEDVSKLTGVPRELLDELIREFNTFGEAPILYFVEESDHGIPGERTLPRMWRN